MKTYIIIIHFGQNTTTANCIKSILENDKDFTKIIVIDNSSDFDIDNKKGAKIVVFKNKSNLGFAKAVNMGIEYAMSKKADYIFLLNNDTIVKEPVIRPLISFLKDNSKVGIIAPAISFTKNEHILFDLGGRVNKLFGRTSHKKVFKIEDYKPFETDYVSGCCMIIKKEVVKKIGLFDQRFFLYYEDVDFCLRAKKLGFLTYVFPSVSINHDLSGSVGKNSYLAVYYQTKSALEFGKKYFKGGGRILNIVFILLQSLYILLKNPRGGRGAFAAFDI